jgi:thiol-disulfide isomerase/thioredoxin
VVTRPQAAFRLNLGKPVAVKAVMNLRFTIVTALGLLGAVSVRADEKLPVLQAGTDVYSNVNVLSVSATDVYFTFNNGKGIANAKLKRLSPDLQKHFHYNPAVASTVEQKQALANVEYRAADHQAADIYGPAATGPPDESRLRPPAVVHASDLTWSTDFNQALAQARADGKMVLLDFTGSDWCPWCIKFDHEVLASDPFATYARNKLELVLVDFPRTKPQDDALKQANRALANQYHVTGYPTLVLVNYTGNELGRQGGYLEGGPGTFISELEKFSR